MFHYSKRIFICFILILNYLFCIIIILIMWFNVFLCLVYEWCYANKIALPCLDVEGRLMLVCQHPWASPLISFHFIDQHFRTCIRHKHKCQYCSQRFSWIKVLKRITLSFKTSNLTGLRSEISTCWLFLGRQLCQHINTPYLGCVFTVNGSITQWLCRAEGVKKCVLVHLIFLDHLSN